MRRSKKAGGGGSLDHLVGAGKQRGRDVEAERLRGLEVHKKIEFVRLLDRKTAGCLALQDFVDVVCSASVNHAETGAVGDNSTGRRKILVDRNNWQRVFRRQIEDLPSLLGDRAIIHDKERLDPSTRCSLEGTRVVFRFDDGKTHNLQTQLRAPRFDRIHYHLVPGIVALIESAHPCNPRKRLTEYLYPLAPAFVGHEAEPGHVSTGARKTFYKAGFHGIGHA